MIHDTQSPQILKCQISQKQDGWRNIYAIMKTMYPLGYHHNDFVAHTYIMCPGAQGRRNEFQSGGAMEHWKEFSATTVGWQEKCLSSRRSRTAKAVTFWPW